MSFIRLHVSLLAPPQLALLGLPFVILAGSALDDGLLSGCLPCLCEMAILEVFLELCDVGAEAVVREIEQPGSRVGGLALLDLVDQRDGDSVLWEHRQESDLLLSAQARPCCWLKEHVVYVRFPEAAGGVGGDIDGIEDLAFRWNFLGCRCLYRRCFLEVLETLRGFAAP